MDACDVAIDESAEHTARQWSDDMISLHNLSHEHKERLSTWRLSIHQPAQHNAIVYILYACSGDWMELFSHLVDSHVTYHW